jgi:nitroreductase
MLVTMQLIVWTFFLLTFVTVLEPILCWNSKSVVHVEALSLGNLFASRRVKKNAAKFQELVVSRRTINEFETELPDGWEDTLQKGIEAAIYAPNHKRTEPWRFHLLGPKSIRRVCELNAELVSAKKGKAAGDKKLQRWLAMPGWLIVTCQKDSSDSNMEDPMGLAREDYAACCCAVQNLCLSLHAHGLGTKWTTGPVNFDDQFANAVGLSDDEYVVGTIWFGTPLSQPLPPKKKLSTEAVFLRKD